VSWKNKVVVSHLCLVVATLLFHPACATRAVFHVDSDFGAVCDDTTDDYAAIQNALDAAGQIGGGTVLLPARVCKTSKTLHFNYSDLTLSGSGTIDFVPSPPFVRYVNDRAVQVNEWIDESSYYDTNLPIRGQIRAGEKSFTVESLSDTTGLRRGDWLVVNEIDQGAGRNIVAIEWVQVSTTSGTTVKVQAPFRVSFPNSRPFIPPNASGLGFFKVKNLIQNSTISSIHVQVPLTSRPVAAIAIGVARNTLVDEVTVDVASGNGFFAYRSNGLTIINSNQLHCRTQASEMAAVTDLLVSGNLLDDGKDLAGSSLTVDFGTGFFQVTQNHLLHCGNICLLVAGGVHDGSISSNTIGYVVSNGLADTAGMVVMGTNGVRITDNSFSGGEGVTSTAIAARNTIGYTSNISSCGNQFGPNSISGFAIHYSPPQPNEFCNLYVDHP
jgi:hypothetical protein